MHHMWQGLSTTTNYCDLHCDLSDSLVRLFGLAFVFAALVACLCLSFSPLVLPSSCFFDLGSRDFDQQSLVQWVGDLQLSQYRFFLSWIPAPCDIRTPYSSRIRRSTSADV